MDDTQILTWVQDNVFEIRVDIKERMTIKWFDKEGIPRTTKEDNLRDCVREAILNIYCKEQEII